MTKFFESKYPIIEAPMNGGSDLNLALAVAEAGAFPSYWSWAEQHNDDLFEVLSEFIKCTGTSNIILGGLDRSRLRDPILLKMIQDLKISHVEFLAEAEGGKISDINDVYADSLSMAGLKFLKRTTKILTRLNFPNSSEILTNQFDGFCLKGKESAGKTGKLSVSDLYDQQRALTPLKILVPYGGVGTPEQVKNYIDCGADAVGVGTLFAACKESPLSPGAKQKILESSSSNISYLTDSNRNALILSSGNLLQDEQDLNRQASLEQGLRGDGTQGLLYAGTAVDHVTCLRTVKETVDYLVSKL